MMGRPTLTFGLLLLGTTIPALAAPVFSQLPGPGSSSTHISSTRDNFNGLPGARTFDNFTLAADTAITNVTWWGSPGSGADDFSITFYAGGATPGVALATFSLTPSVETVDVGSPFNPIRHYTASLGGQFNAMGGTAYWMSIFNGASDSRWRWLRANVSGDGGFQQSTSGGNFITAPNMAFVLGDDVVVPEPSTFLLFAPALAVLVLRRPRKN